MENNIHSNKQLELQEDFQKGKWVTLGFCAEFINGDRGVNYPKHSDYVREGIPFINTGHITPEGWLDLENMQYITYEKFTSLRSGKVINGDIVYCLRGSTGKIARVNLNEGAIASSLVIIRALDGICQDYLFHFLSTNYGKDCVSQYDNGSAQPNLSVNAISKFKIFLPPYEVQVKIAEFINTFDTKISLNNKINQTLDMMAENLFKSWFVDFDPVIDNALDAGFFDQGLELPDDLLRRAEARRAVRANADFKSLPEVTRQLFPASFEQCAEPSLGLGGWVPRGWIVSTAEDEFVVKGGSTPSTKNPDFWEEGDIHWTSPKDLSGKAEKILLNTERKITQEGLKKITSGLLPSGTVLMSSRAPVGYLALTRIPVAINQGYIAITEAKSLTQEYTLYWLDSELEVIKSISGGTTFAEISKNTFRSIPLVLPMPVAVSAFSKIVSSSINKISTNIEECVSLSSIRDFLLPKLISGELEVE